MTFQSEGFFIDRRDKKISPKRNFCLTRGKKREGEETRSRNSMQIRSGFKTMGGAGRKNAVEEKGRFAADEMLCVSSESHWEGDDTKGAGTEACAGNARSKRLFCSGANECPDIHKFCLV